MTGMIANLLLNVLIVGLLVATISYCWILNRRIKILQDSKSELAQLLKHFDESTERASESIIALQTASKKIGENIQHRIDKANYLLDDLAYMIDKGHKLNDQIEAGFAVSRARSKAEEENDRADEAPVARTAPVETKPAKPLSTREKAAASLEAVLERVRSKTPVKTDIGEDEMFTVANGEGGPPLRPRSKTEQELLELLKSGIKG